MRLKLLIFAEVALIVCGLALVGCKKPAQKSLFDPHSPEGLVQTILGQRDLLREGVRSKDYSYVDHHAYYLQGVAKALYAKLDPERKQQLGKLFNDVFLVAEELDHAAGRKHEPAVVASMAKLEGLLKELEAQFQAKTQG
jgi:hypothetical protein